MEKNKQTCLTLSDSVDMRDGHSTSNVQLNEGEVLDKRNLFVVSRKTTGEEVYRGFNIVTADGRKFNGAKIFGVSSTLSNLTVVLPACKDKLEIAAWGAGSGAAPANDLFNPTPAEINDTTLASATKFFALDDTREHPDLDPLKGKYWDNTYKKSFTDKVLKQDSNGDYFIEFTMTIEFSELKGTACNEIGTYIGEVIKDEDGNITNNTNFVLYSRLVFASLPNSEDEKDSYVIKYNVYI